MFLNRRATSLGAKLLQRLLQSIMIKNMLQLSYFTAFYIQCYEKQEEPSCLLQYTKTCKIKTEQCHPRQTTRKNLITLCHKILLCCSCTKILHINCRCIYRNIFLTQIYKDTRHELSLCTHTQNLRSKITVDDDCEARSEIRSSYTIF